VPHKGNVKPDIIALLEIDDQDQPLTGLMQAIYNTALLVSIALRVVLSLWTVRQVHIKI